MTADVDVLIPVRNGGRLLRVAVDSILDQRDVHARVVVVDDGSTDGAPDLLAGDPRIQVIVGPARGVPAALNAGLAVCTAPYIARQDADDESLPGRLGMQVDFLDRHDGIGLVGTAFEVVVGGRTVGTVSPAPRALLQKNPFCAGSVLVRRSVLDAIGGYRSIMSEDYDMALRCAEVSGVAILPDVGYRYRLSATMSTVRRATRQAAYAELVRASARARLAGRPDPVDADTDIHTLDGDPEVDLEVNAWWAHEFAALGAWRDAYICARRLPVTRAARVLAGMLPRPKAQVVWS